MKIVICGSIYFTPKIKEVADELEKMGCVVDIPLTSQKIIRGELTMEEFITEKEINGDGFVRKVTNDIIKRYFEIIGKSDAVLILNLEKKGIPNYIGGNVLIEMAFAHVLEKKIYLYNPIPEMSYADEIKVMQPIVINGDLSQIV